MRRKRLMFQVHLWLGLSLGVYLAVMGLTGSLLVFDEPIDRALNPGLYEARPEAEPRPIGAALSAFRERYPEAEFSRIRLPAEPGAPVAFWIGPWSAALEQVYVAPGTKQIVGRRHLLESVVGFCRYLHFNQIGRAHV